MLSTARIRVVAEVTMKHGRHTPAFLLLFLSESPSYGARLLSRLEAELPFCFSDSAIVYRSLKEMEREGLVETMWRTEEAGPPRKWYSTTEKGQAALDELAEDIRRRQMNLTFFLERYRSERHPPIQPRT